MKMRVFAVLTLALCLALPTMAATNPMKPGKWQISMQIDIPNLPVKMPPMKFTQCVTQEDLDKDPQASIPKDQKNSCKVGDYKVDGNVVTWTVGCPKENMTGSGRITYSDDSYDGEMKMDMDGTESTTKYSAKRLGDCTK